MSIIAGPGPGVDGGNDFFLNTDNSLSISDLSACIEINDLYLNGPNILPNISCLKNYKTKESIFSTNIKGKKIQTERLDFDKLGQSNFLGLSNLIQDQFHNDFKDINYSYENNELLNTEPKHIELDTELFISKYESPFKKILITHIKNKSFLICVFHIGEISFIVVMWYFFYIKLLRKLRVFINGNNNVVGSDNKINIIKVYIQRNEYDINRLDNFIASKLRDKGFGEVICKELSTDISRQIYVTLKKKRCNFSRFPAKPINNDWPIDKYVTDKDSKIILFSDIKKKKEGKK